MSDAVQRAGGAAHSRLLAHLSGAQLRCLTLSASLLWAQLASGSLCAEPQRPLKAEPQPQARAQRLGLPDSPLDHVLTRALELYPEARLSLLSDEGRLDLSEMRLHTVGVGTPLLLSPTGGLATEELSQVARKDARVRLERALNRLLQHLGSGRRAGPEGARTSAALCGAQEAAARALSYARPQRFSDGSVHLMVSLPLRALACPEPSLVGGSALSIVRLQGSPVHELSQLPRLLNERGEPLELSRVRFLREVDQARALILGALDVKVRGLKRHERPGSFVVQGGELKAGEELWVLISAVAPRSGERSP